MLMVGKTGDKQSVCSMSIEHSSKWWKKYTHTHTETKIEVQTRALPYSLKSFDRHFGLFMRAQTVQRHNNIRRTHFWSLSHFYTRAKYSPIYMYTSRYFHRSSVVKKTKYFIKENASAHFAVEQQWEGAVKSKQLSSKSRYVCNAIKRDFGSSSIDFRKRKRKVKTRKATTVA